MMAQVFTTVMTMFYSYNKQTKNKQNKTTTNKQTKITNSQCLRFNNESTCKVYHTDINGYDRKFKPPKMPVGETKGYMCVTHHCAWQEYQPVSGACGQWTLPQWFQCTRWKLTSLKYPWGSYTNTRLYHGGVNVHGEKSTSVGYPWGSCKQDTAVRHWCQCTW